MPSLRDVLRAIADDPIFINSASRPTILEFIDGLADLPSTEGADSGAYLTLAPDPYGQNAWHRIALTDSTVTGGTYTITFDDETTAAIDWDEMQMNVISAINALPTIESISLNYNDDVNGDLVVIYTGNLSEQHIDISRLSMDASGLTGPDAPYTPVVTSEIVGHPPGPLRVVWE